MRWQVKHGDIVDEPADVLICSANPYLNLSGGVGGELLSRFGSDMQEALHAYLRERNLRFVSRGTVVPGPPCGAPYRLLLHAVAVDGFYDSTIETITDIVTRALHLAAEAQAEVVTLAALATGYGRLSLEEFAQGVQPLLAAEFPPIVQVTLVLSNPERAKHLQELLKPDGT